MRRKSKKINTKKKSLEASIKKKKAQSNKFVRAVRERVPGVDFPLVLLVLALMTFGVIMIFSASYYWSMDQYGKPYSYLIKAIIWAGASAGCMFVFSYIDYNVYKKYYKIIFILSIVLLLLLFTPLGKNTKGAVRWIDLKIITIMPGELAKLAAIIFTAGFLSRKKDLNVNSLTDSILPLCAVAAIYAGLIIKQPNMSTAITVVAIIVAMMFVAGVKIRYFMAMIGVGAAGALLYIFKGGSYQLARVTTFLHPFDDPRGDSFQVVQSLMALGSGKLFGKGLGNSVQKTLYLPEPQNDFILAVIGEELGFLGILVLVAVFALLIWRGLRICLKAPDRFGMLMGSGVIMLIGIQLLFNIAIVTSSMPATGVALPFISYGGNAMLVFGAGMGIVLNISRHVKKEEEVIAQRLDQRERIYFTR